MVLSLNKEMEMGDRECIYVFNVLFNRVMQAISMTQLNRNFYNPKKATKIPQYK